MTELMEGASPWSVEGGPVGALCLHGFPESRFSWRFQLPLLAEMGYRAWAPDLRGYGETEPKPKATRSERLIRAARCLRARICERSASARALVASKEAEM